MTDELEITVASSGAFLKKGYGFIVANVGKTVALITLLVTALVSFTEVSFSAAESESFTSTLFLMLISSYVMYFSLTDAGERLGRETESYKQVSERHTKLQEEIKKCDIAKLRAFCLDYRNREHEYRQSNLLFSLGYTKEEYKEDLLGKEMPKKMRKALGRVEKIKRADLTAATLISSARGGGSELKNPQANRLITMILRLVPSTVCMLFTVSVMVSVKDNLTAAGIIEALIKLCTLPVVGLKGYSGGYEYVTVSEIAWLETKSRLIETFLKSEA